MVLLAHEYGHHLTDNPGYDSALKRCLNLPVADRTPEDIQLVLKEEREAWENGFAELQSLGHEIPETARALAQENIEGYRIGLQFAEAVKEQQP